MATTERNSRVYSTALALLYVAFALFGTSIWWTSKQFNSYSRAKFVDLIEGTADAPFVFRRLVPDILHIFRSVFPESWRETVLNTLPELNEFSQAALLTDTSYGVELGVFAFLSFLSFLLFLYSLRKLLLLNFITSKITADLTPCFISLFLPIFYLEGSHFPYDLPALGLFTAALATLQAGQYILYTFFFALAVWNKETALLLGVVAFTHLYDKQKATKTTFFLILQLAIFLLIRDIISFLWRAPSQSHLGMETHLEENLFHIWRGDYLLQIGTLLAVSIASLLLFSNWRLKPVFLRRAFIISPLIALLYLYGGVWGEIRVFYEAFPIVALLIFQSACLIGGIPCEAKTQDQRSFFSFSIKRCSYSYTILLIALPLFLIVSASWLWLVFASRFHQPSLREYRALNNRGSIGQRWNASRHLKIHEAGVTVEVSPPVNGRFLEVTVDNNDIYTFSFFSKGGFLKRITLKPTGRPVTGMELRRMRLPKKARDIPLTKIIIEAKGDGKMSIGHLRILPKLPS